MRNAKKLDNGTESGLEWFSMADYYEKVQTRFCKGRLVDNCGRASGSRGQGGGGWEASKREARADQTHLKHLGSRIISVR